MHLQLPTVVLYILHTLQAAGYEAYIVGGAVRDIILNHQGETRTVKDFDFTTNAKPEAIQELFPQSYYENTFGTVSITATHIAENLSLHPVSHSIYQETSSPADRLQLTQVSKLHPSLSLPTTNVHKTSEEFAPFEITTYRTEHTYTDFRRPSVIEWGSSLTEDLARRDFTINALALSLEQKALTAFKNEWTKPNFLSSSQELTTEMYTIIDPYQGLRDLEQHTIRTVGTPSDRFGEDALRMLRAIRLSVQLNFSIDEETYSALAQLAPHISHISWERISAEFLKMLASPYPAEAIKLLDVTGMLDHILPELYEGKGVQQGGHHTTDVWTHSLDALAACPSSDPIVRFATLLHDIAKPRTYKLLNGKPTFYNHELVGARMAKEIGLRFRLSKQEINRLYLLVRHHMFHYQPENTDAAIRRFMRNVGLENLNDILDLREADRLGSGARKTSWRLEEMKVRMLEQLHQPFAVTDLAIDGSDLMEKFQLQPGKIIGDVLQYLFTEVLEKPELNEVETLFDLAQKYIDKERTDVK